MKNSLTCLKNLDTVNSIPEILSLLTKLDTELTQSKLINLKPFNSSYLIITQNMDKMIKDKSFKNNRIVAQLISNFANAYFDAVKNYHKKRPIPKAWEIAFKFYEKRKSNYLLYLAIGANAHINNDLAFALEKTIKNEDFYSDYQKIGQALELSLNEVISSTTPRFIDKQLLGINKSIIKFLLKEWRRASWRNYINLRAENIIASKIETAASKKAYTIFILSYIVP